MTTAPCEQRINVSGQRNVDLLVETAGEGMPLVWSHALMASMAQDLEGGVMAWRELNDIAQVIRYDARGHGRSGCDGLDHDYDWSHQARNLWEIIDHTTADPVILGGASMGSGISLHAARARPERVRGLVLVIPPRAWEWREGKAAGYRFTAGLMHYTRGLPLRLLKRIPFASEEGDFRRNSRGVMARDLAGADFRGIVGAMRGAALSNFPEKSALEQLDIPALILAWPDDDIHPVAVAEELDRVLPNSRLEVAAGADAPYSWPQKVREFIQSLD